MAAGRGSDSDGLGAVGQGVIHGGDGEVGGGLSGWDIAREHGGLAGVIGDEGHGEGVRGVRVAVKQLAVDGGDRQILTPRCGVGGVAVLARVAGPGLARRDHRKAG